MAETRGAIKQGAENQGGSGGSGQAAAAERNYIDQAGPKVLLHFLMER